jgi:hypothetical protein
MLQERVKRVQQSSMAVAARCKAALNMSAIIKKLPLGYSMRM